MIPKEHIEDFERYLALLLKWNRTYNLTAITDPKEIYEKHFSDSLAPLEFIPDGAALVDIGTGAGFPGIPIRIVRDDVDVTLLEATAKKVSFCQHMIGELGLKKIQVIHGRAEDPRVQEKIGSFDVVISRATLKLPLYIEVGSKFLKEGGRLIAMLGAHWSEDLDAARGEIQKSGLELIKTHEYTLPLSRSCRALLIFLNS